MKIAFEIFVYSADALYTTHTVSMDSFRDRNVKKYSVFI